MPLPPNYRGTQWDWKPNAIDLRPIEPSIREGEHIITSIYGNEATFPLTHTPPVNITPPTIVGDIAIPNTLECLVGTWTGSPYPYFAYQWMANGIDIPGANEKTWVSDAAYDGQEITCEVRGYSNQGEQYVVTPVGVTIVLVVPDFVELERHYILSGLTTEKNNSMWENRSMMVTGMGALNTSTAMRSVGYSITGQAAVGRSDLNDKRVGIITGIGRNEGIDIQGNALTGIVTDSSYIPDLVDGIPQDLKLINWTGNLGMIGWTADSFVFTDTRTSSFDSQRYFSGGDDLRVNDAEYTKMYQDIEVPDNWETDVDAGECFVKVYWQQFNGSQHEDMANIKVQFYTNTLAFISEDFGPGMFRANDDMWFPRETSDIAIPPNTRFIRIHPEWLLHTSIGNDNEAFIREIRAEVWKGQKPQDRDTGPDYDQWRLKFDNYNTWNGIGLGEIEMRNGIGGLDLCTGGTIIAGSSSLGGDPSYAFDDIRNNGFWAGELDGVGLGTAWIGYAKSSPWRPREIDITGRDGSNAAQMAPSMYLEGSDDGINWTKVQYFQDIPEFSSRQQQQFEVWPSGPTVKPQGAQDDNNVPSSATIGIFGLCSARVSLEAINMWTRVTDADVTVTAYLFTWFTGTDGYKYVNDVVATSQSELLTLGTENVWTRFVLDTPYEAVVGEQLGFAFSQADGGNLRYTRRNPNYYNNNLHLDSLIYPVTSLLWSVTDIQKGYRDNNNNPASMVVSTIEGTIF